MYLVQYQEWIKIYESAEAAELNITNKLSDILKKWKINLAGLKSLGDQLNIDAIAADNAQELLPLNEAVSESNIDLMIDVISGILEIVPFAGPAVSFVIDIIHSISYAIRFYLTPSTDTTNRITYFMMTLINLSTSFSPAVGNVQNVVAKATIDKSIKVATTTAAKIAAGTGKAAVTPAFKRFAVTKAGDPTWKMSLLAVVARYLGAQGANVLNSIALKISEALKSIAAVLGGYKDNAYYGWIIKAILGAFTFIGNLTDILTVHADEMRSILPMN